MTIMIKIYGFLLSDFTFSTRVLKDFNEKMCSHMFNLENYSVNGRDRIICNTCSSLDELAELLNTNYCLTIEDYYIKIFQV